jgi:hypothetical protein
MTKGKLTKDRQYHGQRETEKTDNIMDKGNLTKDRHYHGQRKTDFFQLPFGHDIVSLFSASFWA